MLSERLNEIVHESELKFYATGIDRNFSDIHECM